MFIIQYSYVIVWSFECGKRWTRASQWQDRFVSKLLNSSILALLR